MMDTETTMSVEQEDSQVLIHSNKTLTIMGTQRKVKAAKKLVEDMLLIGNFERKTSPVINQEEEQEIIITLLIPQGKVGLVIGSKGKFIRKIKRKSKTSMAFRDEWAGDDQNVPWDDSFKPLTIAGKESNVDKAKGMINDLMEEDLEVVEEEANDQLRQKIEMVGLMIDGDEWRRITKNGAVQAINDKTNTSCGQPSPDEAKKKMKETNEVAGQTQCVAIYGRDQFSVRDAVQMIEREMHRGEGKYMYNTMIKHLVADFRKLMIKMVKTSLEYICSFCPVVPPADCSYTVWDSGKKLFPNQGDIILPYAPGNNLCPI
jgi:hypothetical protein